MAKKSNSLVPDPGRSIEFTEENIQELYKCKQSVHYFARNYCYVIHPTLGKMKADLYSFQNRIIDGIIDHRQSIILAPRQCGKALSIDTPILTPNGFVRLADLNIGDTIYGRDGKSTKIKFITETMHDHDVYDVVFDTNETIKSDAEHLWTVGNSDWLTGEKTLKTTDLVSIQKRLQLRSKASSLFIKSSGPVQFDKKKVRIHPYVLGVWIGDGSRCDSRITCHISDYSHYHSMFTKFGYQISEFRPDKRNLNTGAFAIYGLYNELKRSNLIKNKHIPEEYYLNDVETRMFLLQGLMDTDGYCRKTGSCCFYQSNEDIIQSVKFILHSLGIKCSLTTKKTSHKDCYTLSFASNHWSVFTLPRKVSIQKKCKKHKKNDRIYIRSITKCNSVPVRCLQVDNDDKLFLCGNTLIPTHNTTAVALVILHYAMFTPYKCCAILANKDAKSMSILNDVKTAYESLPDWMKLGVVEYNAHTIKFENGSKIFSAATSKDAIAGESVSFLYIDECALIAEGKAREFYRANYPTISKGEKLVVTSTARGIGNLFHSLWKGAIDKTNTYVPVRVDYWEVPEYSSPQWKEDMIADIGQIAFNSEFGNQFIGSQTTVIGFEALRNMKPKPPIFEEKIHNGTYKIFEKYIPNAIYLAAPDVSTGSGNDYSTMQFFRMEWREPIEDDYKAYENKQESIPDAIITKLIQCAVFRSNLINIPNFVDYVFELLPTWGEPYFILENNGIGQSFADNMTQNYFWENAYYHIDEKKRESSNNCTVGINSSGSTKNTMVTAMKKFAEDGKLVIYDNDTINEFLTFVEKTSSSGNRKFTAEDGSHDDLVVPVGWICFLANTNYMQDILTFH